MKSVPCVCGKFADYSATVQPPYNECLKIHLFACKACGREYEAKQYKHSPATCSHQWEVDGYDFADNTHTWEAWWILHCDKCGSRVKGPRMDSDALGSREAWDMDDPRVLKNLRLSKETARFLLPGDDVKEFWKG